MRRGAGVGPRQRAGGGPAHAALDAHGEGAEPQLQRLWVTSKGTAAVRFAIVGVSLAEVVAASLCDEIREINADVVLLQEVIKAQLEVMRRELGYVFYSNYEADANLPYAGALVTVSSGVSA